MKRELKSEIVNMKNTKDTKQIQSGTKKMTKKEKITVSLLVLFIIIIIIVGIVVIKKKKNNDSSTTAPPSSNQPPSQTPPPSSTTTEPPGGFGAGTTSPPSSVVNNINPCTAQPTGATDKTHNSASNLNECKQACIDWTGCTTYQWVDSKNECYLGPDPVGGTIGWSSDNPSTDGCYTTDILGGGGGGTVADSGSSPPTSSPPSTGGAGVAGAATTQPVGGPDFKACTKQPTGATDKTHNSASDLNECKQACIDWTGCTTYQWVDTKNECYIGPDPVEGTVGWSSNNPNTDGCFTTDPDGYA